ncbi:unnamed protein product, partial [Owenia fusiformis]
MLMLRTLGLLNQQATKICQAQSLQRMTLRFLNVTYDKSNWINHQIDTYPMKYTHKKYHTPPTCVFSNFTSSRCLSQAIGSTCINYELQNQRGFIRLHGKDTVDFLQGLITNDMSSLDGDCKALYAMVLNIQGRVLYDVILYNISSNESEPAILLECDKEIATELYKTLKKYKIRKKVKLEPCSDEYKLWTIFPNDLHAVLDSNITSSGSIEQREGLVIAEQDPRLKDFCTRMVLDSTMKGSDYLPVGATEPSIAQAYNTRRYIHGVSEGILDLPVGKCTPLESNAVFLNGVSFTKGCYIGQELTARTHHTGVIRKRLMPITIQKEGVVVPSDSKIQNSSNKNVGRFRHNIGKYGLGLLRVADVKEDSLSIYLDEEGKETVAA